MISKSTLVVGASTNPERYAYKAIVELRKHKHEVIAYGNKEGTVLDVVISKEWNPNWKIDTVTLYVGPKNQTEELIEKIISLQPRRVIFNPGTENTSFFTRLEQASIQYELACTLVLLSIGEYEE